MSIYSALRFFLSAIILFVFFPLFGQVDTEGKLSQELAMELKEGPEGKKYKIIVVFKELYVDSFKRKSLSAETVWNFSVKFCLTNFTNLT